MTFVRVLPSVRKRFKMSAMATGATDCSLAIVCDSLPPYRIHFHRRIANELPWLKLWTICTHEGDDGRWEQPAPPDLNPVDLASPTRHRHGISWASWRTGGRIIRWLAANRVSAVMVLGYNDPGRLRIFRWCRRHGVAVYVWGDSNIAGDNQRRGMMRVVKSALLRWVVRHTDATMCCGSMGRAFFERYGADPQRIFYLPYEPDYQQISELSPAQITQAVAEFGLPADRRRIVFSGRLVSYKNPDLLMRAFFEIASRRPEWDLLIIGDGELRAELERIVPPSLKTRVYWTGFVGDQATISALYRGSDVLVLPSSYEPWALVINEAAAAGMAIICTSVVGAGAELAVDNVNGFRVSAGQLPVLTEALLKVTDPEQIDRYRNASLQVLADWRTRADPVNGLKRALRHAGVCLEH